MKSRNTKSILSVVSAGWGVYAVIVGSASDPFNQYQPDQVLRTAAVKATA